MQVGFIGLGDQGAPMAERVVAAGWPLTVWARRRDAAEKLAAAGATVAAEPADLAERCDLVEICVTRDVDVLDVLDQLESTLRPGAILAVHSTVAPSTCVEVQRRVAGRGVRVLDAPVSGGRPRAREGTLAVMVGGEAGVFEAARPVMESFGQPRLVGPLGAGQVMKLLNNELLMAQLLLADEAVEWAQSFGVDRTVAETVLMDGSGASSAMGSRLRFRQMDLERVRTVLSKDHELFAAHRDGPPTHLAELAAALIFRMAEGRWD